MDKSNSIQNQNLTPRLKIGIKGRNCKNVDVFRKVTELK